MGSPCELQLFAPAIRSRGRRRRSRRSSASSSSIRVIGTIALSRHQSCRGRWRHRRRQGNCAAAQLCGHLLSRKRRPVRHHLRNFSPRLGFQHGNTPPSDSSRRFCRWSAGPRSTGAPRSSASRLAGMELDLGGVVKEYAVDRVAASAARTRHRTAASSILAAISASLGPGLAANRGASASAITASRRSAALVEMNAAPSQAAAITSAASSSMAALRPHPQSEDGLAGPRSRGRQRRRRPLPGRRQRRDNRDAQGRRWHPPGSRSSACRIAGPM